MKMALDTVSQHKLYIEVTPSHQTKHVWIFGRGVSVLTMFLVACKYTAALIGIDVQPAARLETDNENTKTVVRSSRC